MIQITNTWLHQHCSRGTAWMAAQFRVLGITWPPYHGWKRDVLGRVISEETADAFAVAATSFATNTRKLRRREAQAILDRDWASEK